MMIFFMSKYLFLLPDRTFCYYSRKFLFFQAVIAAWQGIPGVPTQQFPSRKTAVVENNRKRRENTVRYE